MAFFLCLLIGFLFVMLIKDLVENSNNITKSGCPPHNWESVENLKMRNGSVYSGLYCKNCGSIPNYVGRE